MHFVLGKAGDWLRTQVAGSPYMPRCLSRRLVRGFDAIWPEAVAEMADFFVRLEGCRWSLVGGAYDGEYYLSLRTSVGERGAYTLLGVILDGKGSFGGHGRIAGGRVGLDDPADVSVRELERGLRERVLSLIGTGGKGEDEPDSEVVIGRPLA